MVAWVIKFTKTSFFCIFLCFSPKAPEDSRYFHYITMTKRLEHIIFPVFSTLYHIIYMYFNLCTLCVCSWQTVEGVYRCFRISVFLLSFPLPIFYFASWSTETTAANLKLLIPSKSTSCFNQYNWYRNHYFWV